MELNREGYRLASLASRLQDGLQKLSRQRLAGPTPTTEGSSSQTEVCILSQCIPHPSLMTLKCLPAMLQTSWTKVLASQYDYIVLQEVAKSGLMI